MTTGSRPLADIVDDILSSLRDGSSHEQRQNVAEALERLPAAGWESLRAELHHIAEFIESNGTRPVGYTASDAAENLDLQRIGL